jgi:uncharacterized protein (DUF2267 family)
MNYDRFLSLIQREAAVDRQVAEAAARVTLETLAERLMAGNARKLARQLPPELTEWLSPKHRRETFEVDEFLRRIGEREGVDVKTADKHARAVFYALSRALSADEFTQLLSELPKSYWELVGPSRRQAGPILPLKEFLRRVADRAGIEVDEAQRAAETVLETLAQRVAGGEVDDLVKELPRELHAPLLHGKAQTGGIARRMSFDEFIHLVGERAGVSEDQAHEYARAVIATLRDAVTQKEFHDLTSELPRVYVKELTHA